MWTFFDIRHEYYNTFLNSQTLKVVLHWLDMVLVWVRIAKVGFQVAGVSLWVAVVSLWVAGVSLWVAGVGLWVDGVGLLVAGVGLWVYCAGLWVNGVGLWVVVTCFWDVLWADQVTKMLLSGFHTNILEQIHEDHKLQNLQKQEIHTVSRDSLLAWNNLKNPMVSTWISRRLTSMPSIPRIFSLSQLRILSWQPWFNKYSVYTWQ